MDESSLIATKGAEIAKVLHTCNPKDRPLVAETALALAAALFSWVDIQEFFNSYDPQSPREYLVVACGYLEEHRQAEFSQKEDILTVIDEAGRSYPDRSHFSRHLHNSQLLFTEPVSVNHIKLSVEGKRFLEQLQG